MYDINNETIKLVKKLHTCERSEWTSVVHSALEHAWQGGDELAKAYDEDGTDTLEEWAVWKNDIAMAGLTDFSEPDNCSAEWDEYICSGACESQDENWNVHSKEEIKKTRTKISEQQHDEITKNRT